MLGDAGVTAGKALLSVNVSGSVKDSHHRSLEIPTDTVLAYACYELTMDSGIGTVVLRLQDRLEPDKEDKQTTCCGIFDEPDGQGGK